MNTYLVRYLERSVTSTDDVSLLTNEHLELAPSAERRSLRKDRRQEASL